MCEKQAQTADDNWTVDGSLLSVRELHHSTRPSSSLHIRELMECVLDQRADHSLAGGLHYDLVYGE